jgi:phosphoribosyl 1,2-cyclic phosphodiesterase
VDIFVQFWGTRGSIPTPGLQTRKYGGNTSCVELRIGETLIICDAGTGIRELGMDLTRRSSKPIEAHLFFSHMHWDHIQGFPFFVPAYAPSNTINVYETAPGENRIEHLLHGQMRTEYFPVGFSDLGSQIVTRHLDERGSTTIGPVHVRCFEQVHPGRSFAYSFECDGKKIVYATDSEVDLTLADRDRAAQYPDELRRCPEALARFIEGADLLIADGQYTDEEYLQKVGWGHPRASTVIDLAMQARVKQCAIFHHDPLHADLLVDAIIDRGRLRVQQAGSPLVIFGAREGLELKF